MYVFGGFDGKTRFSDLQRFSLDVGEWEEIAATACAVQNMHIQAGADKSL